MSISGNESLAVLFNVLKKEKQEAAIVLHGKSYAGISLGRSMLRRGLDFSRTKARNVAHKVPVVNIADPFEKVVRLMLSSDARMLPVEEKGMIVGVIRIQRVLRELKKHAELSGMRASDLSSDSIITLNERQALTQAIRLMREKGIRKIPLVDDRRNLRGGHHRSGCRCGSCWPVGRQRRPDADACAAERQSGNRHGRYGCLSYDGPAGRGPRCGL